MSNNDGKPIVKSEAEILEYVAGFSDDDLNAAAAEIGVVFLPDDTREEKNAKVVADVLQKQAVAVADAEALAAKEKAEAERLAFFSTKEGKKHRKAMEDRDRNDAVRRVHASFIQALPGSARSQGFFEVPEDHPEAGSDLPVPSGGYRVAGSDWVMRFKGGRWVSADRAHARAAPDWVDIPDREAPLPPING